MATISRGLSRENRRETDSLRERERKIVCVCTCPDFDPRFSAAKRTILENERRYIYITCLFSLYIFIDTNRSPRFELFPSPQPGCGSLVSVILTRRAREEEEGKNFSFRAKCFLKGVKERKKEKERELRRRRISVVFL